jgi:hypothetical protein
VPSAAPSDSTARAAFASALAGQVSDFSTIAQDELDKGIKAESAAAASAAAAAAAASAAAAAARAAQARPVAAPRAHTGAKKPPPGKRLMRPWPDHVPFTYRDSMRIRFLLNGREH